METTSAPLGIPSYGFQPGFPILGLGAISEKREGLSKCSLFPEQTPDRV